MQVGHDDRKRVSPPKDGTFLVLVPYQIDNLDLLCAIKSAYPHTEIIARQPIPSR